MKAIDRELELTTRALLAAEDWAPAYAKAPKQHAELIKLTAKMQRQVLLYLRDLAKQAPSMVNWFNYSAAVAEQQMAMHADGIQAYDVNVIINNDAVTEQDQAFIKVVFDTVATTIATGTKSLEVEHGMPIGLSSTSTIIQDLTTKQLANLVGMKVQKDGKIVPNTNINPATGKAYSIDETTRTKIANSVKRSIQIGESHTEAVKRLQDVIADADRAEMIAYTEQVRAYGTGRATYARQADASYKVWSDSNAIDVCADNTSEGPIPIDANFIGGVPNEPQHIRCKCLTVYLWADSEDEAKSQWADY